MNFVRGRQKFKAERDEHEPGERRANEAGEKFETRALITMKGAMNHEVVRCTFG